MSEEKNENMAEAIPVSKNKPAWLMWMLPVLAVLIVGSTLLSYIGERGINLIVHFDQGYGLSQNDYVKHRGIIVGEVKELKLNKSLDGVSVRIELDRSARNLAREGSRFWVVRPELNLEGTAGLETVVGAKYINVHPGEGKLKSVFTGLEKPPLDALSEEGGLKLTLKCEDAAGIRPGAMVSYKQVPIGKIVNVDLNPENFRVELSIYIRPEFRPVVRKNSIFWKTGGAEFKAGLFSGVSLNVDSVHALLLGGISLGTPTTLGDYAEENDVFWLKDDMPSAVDRWEPDFTDPQ